MQRYSTLVLVVLWDHFEENIDHRVEEKHNRTYDRIRNKNDWEDRSEMKLVRQFLRPDRKVPKLNSNACLLT